MRWKLKNGLTGVCYAQEYEEVQLSKYSLVKKRKENDNERKPSPSQIKKRMPQYLSGSAVSHINKKLSIIVVTFSI